MMAACGWVTMSIEAAGPCTTVMFELVAMVRAPELNFNL